MSKLLKKGKDIKKTTKATKKVEKKIFNDDLSGSDNEDNGIKIKTKSKLEQLEKDEELKLKEQEKLIQQAEKEAQEEVTWEETKHLEEGQENKNNQLFEAEKKEGEEETKVEKRSWVPQQAKVEEGGADFKAEEEYMPSLGDPDAEKNAPKIMAPPRPVQQATPGQPGRPQFINSGKNNLEKLNAPLELTEQQKKMMEMDSKFTTSYNTSGGIAQQEGSDIQFGERPKFTVSGGLNKNLNTPLQLTPQQLKEQEIEAKLMQNRQYKSDAPFVAGGADSKVDENLQFKAAPFKMSNAAKKVDNSAPLQMSAQQLKEMEMEKKLSQQKDSSSYTSYNRDQQPAVASSSGEAYKPRFGNTGKVAEKTFKPLEKTEQQKKMEELEQKQQLNQKEYNTKFEGKSKLPEQQEQEQKQEDTQQQQRPAMRFTNSKKGQTSTKPLEKTEQQLKLEKLEKELQDKKDAEEKAYQERKNRKFNKDNKNIKKELQQQQNDQDVEEHDEEEEDGWIKNKK